MFSFHSESLTESDRKYLDVFFFFYSPQDGHPKLPPDVTGGLNGLKLWEL